MSLKVDGTCLYGGACRKGTVVYELHDKTTDMDYVGKTQRYLKTRTVEHIADVWKVIASGRKTFGPNWYGFGTEGFACADAFSKHFGEVCRDCKYSYKVRAKIKTILEPSV
jgi:hypothetical protein